MQKHWASSQNRERFRWFLKIKNLSSTVLPSFFSGPLCLSPSPSAMLNSSARKIDCIIIHPPQRILCLVGAQIQSKFVKMELTNLKLSCHQPNGSLCSTPNKLHQITMSKVDWLFQWRLTLRLSSFRWRKCHVNLERATLLRAGCSLDLLGKDWECQPLTTCRPCCTPSLPHPESHSQIFPKPKACWTACRGKAKAKTKAATNLAKYKDWPLEKQTTQRYAEYIIYYNMYCIQGYHFIRINI